MNELRDDLKRLLVFLEEAVSELRRSNGSTDAEAFIKASMGHVREMLDRLSDDESGSKARRKAG